MRSKILALVLIPLSLLAGALVGHQSIIPLVHGASSMSQVCLADPGFPISPGVNACPLTLQSFTGPNATHAGAQLRVNVNANNTSSFNGYDIILVVDHTRLQPFGVDTSSSLISTASIQKECIGGVPTVGVCDNQDNIDTLHLSVGGQLFTLNPAVGVLFTAIFNIVGNTTSTASQIKFQTGCGLSTSLTPVCVTLSSGGSVPVPITAVRTATYATSSTSPFQPFFTFKTKPLVLNYTAGITGTGANANITMSELNRFRCGGINCVDLSFIKPPVNGLTVGLNVTSVSDPPTNAAKLSVNINTFVPAGIYTIYVLGAPDTLNTPLSGTTYVGAITNVTLAVVASSDFAIAASPSTVIANVGTPGTTTVQVAGGKSFTSTVSLTSSTSPSGMACNLIPASLTPASSPWLIKSTLSCTTNTGGVFTVIVTGTSGSIFHTTMVTYNVNVTIRGTPDFTMLVSLPGNITIPTGTFASFNVTLVSLNLFSGSGTFTTSVSPVCCPGAPQPTATFVPSSFTLTAGGIFPAKLIIAASNTAPPGGRSTWNVVATATSGSLTRITTIPVLVTGPPPPPPPPPDKPPVANFTFSPVSPVVGQQVIFDGSGSHDPDGFVTSWQWSFGDGFISFGEFPSHVFASPGSFTVTLTVTDNAGLTGSTSMVVNVRAQPVDDVSIVNVNVFPTVVVSTQTADVQILVRNDGQRNETVSVTAFFDSHVIGTKNGIFVQACGFFFNCQNPVFVSIRWDTTGVAAGNYTISATVFLANDPTPADNTLKDGTVRVLPPPVLTVTPSSGSLGTLVTVHGSGFPNSSREPFFFAVEIQMTFDDQLLGFFFLQGSSFNFTFDVPHAQAGIVHHVHAIELFPFSLNVQADFLVLPEPGTLAVSVDTGAVYFPGDTAVIYVLASQGGVPVGPANLQVRTTLVLPNGTSISLVAKSISTGLFKATYAIPTTGSLGTYGLMIVVHSSGGDGSALASFEVKPTWLSEHGPTIMGAATIAGVVGVLGLAWQKGYLSRRKVPPLSQHFEDFEGKTSE